MKNTVTKKLLLGAMVLPMLFAGAAMAEEQPEAYASDARGSYSPRFIRRLLAHRLLDACHGDLRMRS